MTPHDLLRITPNPAYLYLDQDPPPGPEARLIPASGEGPGYSPPQTQGPEARSIPPHVRSSSITTALTQTPWVVLRRALPIEGLLPVGIRGLTRADRYPAWLHPQAILETLTPPTLLRYPIAARQPAFQSLAQLKHLWQSIDLAWGPTGSVGFELATGFPAVTPTSDLDLQLRTPHLSLTLARHLLASTQNLPTAVDIQVETPNGAFHLEEYSRGGPYLLRTLTGPILWRAAA